jgi:hypothetical protein
VGAVGQPRDNNPKAAYVVYDMNESTIELRRLDYHIATAPKENSRRIARTPGLWKVECRMQKRISVFAQKVSLDESSGFISLCLKAIEGQPPRQNHQQTKRDSGENVGGGILSETRPQ